MVVLTLVAGSCRRGSDGDDFELSRPPTSSTIPASTSTTFSLPTTQPTTTAGPTTTTPPSGPALVLAPEGLGAVRFGEEDGAVLARLGAVLGTPVDDSPLESCPSGAADRLVQFSELAVVFAGRRFVAWEIGPSTGALPAPLATAEGITVGSTVSALRSAYPDRLDVSADDAFGPSFEIEVAAPGRLGGTLTGTSASDTVATLRAGDTACGG